jgi:putative ABC transport system permease protein
MQKLFGIATDTIATYNGMFFAVAIGILIVLALRNPILARMGIRNIPRRPAQSLLIIIGLMLSTVIIGASLGIGDTVYHSIRITALESVGHIDETVESPLRRFSIARYFPEDNIDKFEDIFRGDERVDGIISRIGTSLPVMNPRTNKSESRMTIRGYAADKQDGFGTITSTADDKSIRLLDLNKDQVILNKNASDVLGAKVGDLIDVYSAGGINSYHVVFIAQHGGLASGGGTKLVLMTLEQAQELTGRQGVIDWIGISNLGGIEDSLDASEEVARILRVSLIDKSVASEIAKIIANEEVFNHLNAHINKLKTDPTFKRENPLDDDILRDVEIILSEISQGNYSSELYLGSIADQSNLASILGIIAENDSLEEFGSAIGSLLPRLNELNVNEYKSYALRIADTVGTSITTLFTIFGSFSIIVGLLLIFLIMVLLASSRSAEMGMARAIGLKQRHLVQMFTFEGAIYALIAALIGTGLGALISIILVGLLQRAVGGDEVWAITLSFTAKSMWIAFSSGFLLTLLTIVISSYRVSKLNIVVAIRGLSEEFIQNPQVSWREYFVIVFIGLLGPLYVLMSLRSGISLLKLFELLKSTLLWPFSIGRQIVRVLTSVLSQGWVLIILGILIHRIGMNLDNGTLFSIGVSMSIIGLGITLRKVLAQVNRSQRTVNRIAATLEGGLLCLFWGVPFGAFEAYSGKLNTTPDIFVLSGVAQIGSAVWLVMNNSEILLGISNRTLGRLSGLQATFKTAIAYPVAAPFRTGLTVSMFGLVIFTLMIFAVLNNINNVAREQPDRVTGGYDIVASVNPEFSITAEEFRDGISGVSELDLNEFEVIAQSTDIPSIAREIDGETQRFSSLTIRSVDHTYLDSTLLQFIRVHPDYLGNDRLVWDALAENTNLAVINNAALPTSDPFGPQSSGLKLSSIATDSEDNYWPEDGIKLEILPVQGDGDVTNIEVIGILDSLADERDWASSVYIVTGREIANQVMPEITSYDTYSIMLSESAEASDLVPYIETAFIERGMEAVSTIDQIERGLEQGDAFNQLFQGFMGLGLVVGVIAIGVLSIRSVVERRQTIGTMRAIGYRARMVWLSFLLESLYITSLGIVLGLGLGALTSWNIFNEIAKEVEGIRYSIPWFNVLVIVGITLFFALLSSFLPSRQASRIYPAEALRYE